MANKQVNIRTTSQSGLALVETVVALGIAVLILVFSTVAVMSYLDTGLDVSEKTQALYLAEAELELVRFVRDKDWNNIDSLTDGQLYYIEFDVGDINITSTQETIEGYTRGFYVEDVYRNSSDEIVASTTGGSSADPNSKYVTSVVTWGSPTKTVTLTTILADIEP